MLQIYCSAPCVAAQCSMNTFSLGDMYQGWTHIGDAMSILTPDKDLSTDLLFVTLNVDPLTVFQKVSVVSLAGTMSQIYLNGNKIEVGLS